MTGGGALLSETRVGSQLGRKGWPELISILVTAPPQPRTSEFFQVAPLSQLGSGPACPPLPERRGFRAGPPLSPLPSFLAQCHGTLLSPALCCHLLLQNLRSSANRRAGYHASHNRLPKPLGLNRKATAVHQRLLL